MSQTIPAHYNFAYDVIEQRWAAQRPDATALWWIDDAGQRELKISFAEMARQLRRAANFLAAQGIRRGDRVLIILQRVPQWWIAMLGLVRLGAVPIPGTPILTPKDIRYRIDAAKISAVITDEVGAAKISEDFDGPRILVGPTQSPREGWVSFDEELPRFPDQCPYDQPTASSDPAIIYFTSGTTGEPKMVLHTHVSFGMGHGITGQYWLDLQPGDMLWTLADNGWAKTAWSSFYSPWIRGATVFTMDMRSKFDPGVVLKTLASHPITVFCAPATALRLMVRKDLSAYQFPHLRHCVSAGEALNPPVVNIWKNATGLTIYEGYGQTETVCLIANCRCRNEEVRPGSMGKPTPGFDIAILDEDHNELPAGAVGQIAIRVKPDRPLGLFPGYVNNPEENAARFIGDWYLTGDTAYRDEDGYFYFVGRADDVINSASYRIGPAEVESALLEHPSVLEAGVIGVPEEMRGEIVRAYVVLREGWAPGDSLKRELQDHCKQVTAPYKYPRQIVFVPELPKTVSGKIRRVELRARAAAEGPVE